MFGFADSMGVSAEGETAPIDEMAGVDSVGTDSTLAIDPFATDSTGVGTEDGQVKPVYFRKSFEVDGTPVGGEVYVTADENFQVFLNGEYMLDDALNDFSKLDTLDYYTLEYSIRPGSNLISVSVLDSNQTEGGLKFYGFFEILPTDITAAAEKQATVKKVEVDPVVLRKVNVLNKNRISTR
jgi:hypothetical protein